MKLSPLDRNFSMPLEGGQVCQFRPPQVMKRQHKKGEPGSGNWVKFQHELSYLAYGDSVTGDEFRFLCILHDQLYRPGNRGDARRFLIATYRQWEDAMGASNNHVRNIVKSLLAKGLVGSEEVVRGVYRFWLAYNQGYPEGWTPKEIQRFEQSCESMVYMTYWSNLCDGLLWVPFSVEPWFINAFVSELTTPPPLGPDGTPKKGAYEALLRRYGDLRRVATEQFDEQVLPQRMRDLVARVEARIEEEEKEHQDTEADSQSVSDDDAPWPDAVRFRPS